MNETVLLVDDDPSSRYMLKALPEGHGFAVVEAEDGAHALTAARVAVPDVAVTDLQMPGMDGFAFAREWMADERLRDVPMVVYTATYTAPEDRELVLDLGAAAFVVKPQEPEELLRVVVSAMANGAPGPKRAGPRPSNAEFFERYSRRLQDKLGGKILQLAGAREDLAAYVTRCEAILDSSTNAIISIDPEGRIRTWNFGAESTFGYSEGEAIGLSLAEILPAEKVREMEGKLADARASKAVVRWETEHVAKDGERVEVAAALSDLGPDIGYVAIATDLTLYRQAVAEKKRLEEQLALAARMESVGRLAGGVAHDFNNLLTVILAHAGFIENDPAAGDCPREDASQIRAAAERAAALTRQLLAFSRKQTVKLEVVDVNQVVRSIESMLLRIIGEDMDLRVELADDLGMVEADRSQLEQVILNLAVNARDAMPDGGTLTLRTAGREFRTEATAAGAGAASGSFIELSVTDTGVGMDAETRAHAFDPFFTTKERGKGTGLGLATVYGIVEQCGGFTRIDSAPGWGTSVSAFLPRVERSAAPERTGLIAQEVRGHGERILLVEDEAMVRRLARRILERAGYAVRDAGSSAEALELLEAGTEQFDLLLTDVVLPGLNGRQLAERVVTLRPSVKVIFTSGYTDDAIAHRGVLDAGLSLLSKPFSAASLTALVRDVLEGRAPGGVGGGE